MKTPKKIGKAIAKKFKNWKGTAAPKETATQEPSASSSNDLLEEPKKPSEEVPSAETTIEQQLPSPTAINIETTTVEPCDNSNITKIEDQDILFATPIVDDIEAIETTTQELGASDNLSLAEIKPCFDSDATNKGKNSSIKTTQQRQAILAGLVGTALLVSSVALYILEMHVIAVVGGVVGLACVSFVLYNILKPNTKLEKVKDMEHLVSFESNVKFKKS